MADGRADQRVGNDVVDLGDPETQTGASHRRFDARVFGASERAAIERAASPRRRRWQLWAAKEAAFKALRRTDPELSFRPAEFRVDLCDEGHARVRSASRELLVRFDVTRDRIHAFVGSPGRVATARLAGGESPGHGVRRLALALARRQFPGDTLRVDRRGRIPHMVRTPRFPGPPESSREQHVPLSLSHHGRFVACALAEGPA